MKNLITKYILLSCLALVALNSCKQDFLDVEPKGKLIAQKTDDYDLMFNNNTLVVPGPSTDGQIALGDEVTIIDPHYALASLRELRLFHYEDVVYEASEDAVEMSALMKQLYTYNKIAAEVMDSKGGSLQQRTALKAEAQLNRAWIYFMLNNYYGKPYNASTASSDLSFPIITAADVTATSFNRATVQEVYDFIIGDLQAAIAGLPVSPLGRTRGAKAAAEGMLGKVYVFMGKYAQGLVQFNNALDHLPANYSVRLYDYNITMANNGSWGYNSATSPLSFVSGTPNLPDHEENLLARQITNSYSFISPVFLLNQQSASLYGPTDLRLRFFTRRVLGSATEFSVAGVLRKNGPVAAQIGLTMPDIYLLRAECKARTNDVPGAKADLELLRKNRMPASAAAVEISDPTEMIRFIIQERTREFALQGYRWFDMRRLSTDPIFSGTTYSHNYVKSSGEINTYVLRPERFVFRFPEKVMTANPGMQNNP
ncbi:RagB/SusD family nutrient uptake outer membrane protein [Pedobacter sp. KBW01]|uniref:RagB/SusD family nutrient uptake outer membrane protein n=1 Tax=Pedobacter sp. KBW01 TaxID=2153364 RepID=UPI000F5A7E96|nr:RagB/SusD family nutrient uptake outer membrane protein [Pedobacter sp. KBW01]RQO64771.1 RagB/SusD family nutrient uptake outer membrane protein [Pedobacter sp. KBW01]